MGISFFPIKRENRFNRKNDKENKMGKNKLLTINISVAILLGFNCP